MKVVVVEVLETGGAEGGDLIINASVQRPENKSPDSLKYCKLPSELEAYAMEIAQSNRADLVNVAVNLLRIQRQLINEINRSGDWNQAIDSILVLQSEIEAAIGLINLEKQPPLKFAAHPVLRDE